MVENENLGSNLDLRTNTFGIEVCSDWRVTLFALVSSTCGEHSNN